jgi:hypothetical protein
MNQSVFAVRNVYDKLIKVIGDWETLRFYWQTYVLSRFDNVEPDIYIVSYPKCGRTWLRVMLQKYLERRGAPLQYFNDRSLLGVLGEKTIKFEHDQGNWVPAPMRTSQLHFNTAKYVDRKVAFLVRDPRDVLVSSWYHLKYRERIYQKGLSEFIRDDLVGIHKVVAFMNMWVEHSHVLADFCLLNYEQLHRETPASFERMLEFMGFEVESDALRYAVEASSFKEMKRMELEGSLKEPWMKPGAKNLENSLKVRKGKIGGFREKFSEEDIEYLNEVIRRRLSSRLSFYYQ